MTDREFDAKVAVEVMRLNVVAHDWPCGYMPDGCELEASYDRSFGGFHQERHPVYATREPWSEPYTDFDGKEVISYSVEPVKFYSTNIAAAWEVFDHMKNHLAWYRFVEALKSQGDIAGGTQADSTLHWLRCFLIQLTPQTICLAALEAVQVKV